MSTPEDSKTTSGMASKEQVLEGFKAVSEVHKNIAAHLDSYVDWLDKAELDQPCLQMQIELLSNLHAKLQ